MSIYEWVKAIFKKSPIVNVNTATIDMATDIYIKELSIAVAISMIASTVSKCEFRTFLKGKPYKGSEYYLWNIQPNSNQNASDFIQKMISTLCYENEVLVVEVNGQLYVADSFSKDEYALYDEIFSNVQIKNITLEKRFKASEVIYLKLNDINVKYLLDNSYNEYGKTIAHAIRAFLRTNVEKGILEVDTVTSMKPDFQEELKDLMANKFKPYFEAERAVLPLTKGYKYTEQRNATSTLPSDISERINYQFEMSGRAFKIPKSLMLGDVSDVKEITKNFLTFSVEPITKKLSKEITRKKYGEKNFISGNYLEINTNAIQHIDVFDTATAADKLLSSGLYCVDELRTKLGDVPLDEEWSKKHYITKNYAEATQFKHLGGGEE